MQRHSDPKDHQVWTSTLHKRGGVGGREREKGRDGGRGEIERGEKREQERGS